VVLIVGLGNPGPRYESTRHNVGFMILDILARRYNGGFKKSQDPYEYARLTFESQGILLLKPLTYMNESGLAVTAGISRFDIDDFSKLLIVCDDLNLPFGTVRLRKHGSDGGQKGLRSIIEALGTQEFPRLRFGIGDHFIDAVEFVLSPFNSKEAADLPQVLGWAADAIESWIGNGIQLTMSKYNKHMLDSKE
jgi:PTH1 family peptidyl-tRNA hydrolase